MAKHPPQDPAIVRSSYLRNLMLDAWDLATSGVDRFGGTRSEYICPAIQTTWSDTKAYPAAWNTAALTADFEPR